MREEYRKLIEHIESYLFGDLETLFSIPKQEKGDLGFTTFQVITSGIELFGLLESKEEYENAFYYFCKTYLSKYNTNYAEDSHLKLLYLSGRNGIAHSFQVYGGIIVDRLEGENLKVCKKDGKHFLYINCKEYFSDFKKGYGDFKDKLQSEKDFSLKGFLKFKKMTEDGYIKADNLVNNLELIPDDFKYFDMLRSSASISYTFSQNAYNCITKISDSSKPSYSSPLIFDTTSTYTPKL